MEKLPKNPVIGIVGGRGEMGVCFQNFFKRQGLKNILISGRNPDGKKVISNKELAQKADVIIISVTLENTVDVINEIAPQLNHNQFLIDLSSIKTPQVEAMLKSKAEVLGTHPMFGGSVSFSGQVVVICPARVKEWKGWFENLLEKEGVKIIKLSPEEHDRRVPFLQALPHFLGFVFSETLKESGEPLEKIRELATPNAKILLDFAARVISQDAKLVHEIQKANPHNIGMRNFLEAAMKKWNELISNSCELTAFKTSLEENKKFFGSFLEEGKEESQLFLDTIVRLALKKKESEKIRGGTLKGESQTAKIPTAIFGGEGSNTSVAAMKFFREIERRGDMRFFTPTISKVFEHVKNEKARNGVVPFENENGGIIRETFEQLFGHKSEIKIDSLIDVEIHHALATNPETETTKIRTIHSHPQALTQCAENLQKFFPGVEIIVENSTVAALEKIKRLKNAAALGLSETAEEIGLKIIEHNFEDRPQSNKTTFAVITKRHTPRGGSDHTLAAFSFEKNEPGQLVKVLEVFQNLKINLSKIQSISHEAKGDYIFFIELEGSILDPNIERAFEMAGKFATIFDFGSYKKI